MCGILFNKLFKEVIMCVISDESVKEKVLSFLSRFKRDGRDLRESFNLS